MTQTATFYILEIKVLETLQKANDSGSNIKRAIRSLTKKKPDSFASHLNGFAIETIKYRWSGSAYTVLAVFAKEKLEVDLNKLEYNKLADELSEKNKVGVYIFSTNDDLFKLKPNGFYYSIEELDEFAIEFKGSKPANPGIMKDAVKILDEALSKLSDEKVVLLLIR